MLAWGSNDHGQCGTGAACDSIGNASPCGGALTPGGVSFVACGGEHTVAVTRAGVAIVFGCNNSGQLGLGESSKVSGDVAVPTIVKVLEGGAVEAKPFSGVNSVSCGASFALACGADGQLFTWGANDCGQLGHGVADG